MYHHVLILAMPFIALASSGCSEELKEIADVAPGWQGSIVAKVDQSYPGWDVEIGDADNDGKNEILCTGSPNSRLYLFKHHAGGWQTRLLAENLAEQTPGMGLTVKVVDLNQDGQNEVIVGTGQEGGGTAFFYLFQMEGATITKKLVCRPEEENKSAYTHNFAMHDLDNDGLLEVISAYCGGGEIMRYDIDADLTQITARKLYQVSGSGEESLIADVDNDGDVEYLTANGFRQGKARVEIFEFDKAGELITPPRHILEGFDGNTCFYASFTVGDVDNDGKNELIVGWKREQKVNKATLLGYRIGDSVEKIYTFESETPDLDMAYFEKMMAIADADNDGKNELVISTRGDNQSEFIASEHLGRVFMYKLNQAGTVDRTLLVNFNEAHATSSWLTVGDADNDGKNEVVLATGIGDRTLANTGYVILVEKKQGSSD